MLKIQEALMSGATPAQLTEKYAIVARHHPKFDNLLLFKYNQIDSPMAEPLVRECRGLILDESDNWRVICRPFDKFFNFGEGHASVINWNTAMVQEKLDGSLCTLYWYNGIWNVATSGSPDAGGNVNDLPNMTFASLFWDTFQKQKLSVPPHSDVDINYMFELMTPYNRIVVRHMDCQLKLIGVRDRFSGQELSVYGPRAVATGYPAVRAFALNSVAAIESSFDTIDPMSQEGYVVLDSDFNRNKMKHPGYVAIHHLKDGFGMRRIVEIMRSGEVPEFLTYFPEWAPQFEKVGTALKKLIHELETAYLQIEDFPDQKTFALEAVKTRCSGALFSVRSKRAASIKAYLADMNIKSLMSMLELQDIDYTA